MLLCILGSQRMLNSRTTLRREDMARLFDSLDPELMRTNTPEVIAHMMDMIRQHQVHLRGVVSTVVVS